MITKSVIAMLIGFSFSLIFGTIFIPFFKKIEAKQTVSVYLKQAHKSKEGIPTMGGIIFMLSTILTMGVLLFLNKIHITYTLGIILFTLVSYFIIGFIDDYLIIKRHKNIGLTIWQKFVMQFMIATIFFYLFMKAGNEPLLWIHSLHFKLNIGFLYGLFILFVLVASSNAVNITDGLDGLAAGLTFFCFITFGIISWNSGWLLGFEDIAVLAFVIAGSILGFLVFNVNPARIFMGDTGSLALGASLGAYAIMTRHEVLLILIGFVFAIETLSCVIQIIYYKLTKKRFFPMTPIHHTLEKKGMKENEIVRLFWLIGLICCLISLIYGVIL